MKKLRKKYTMKAVTCNTCFVKAEFIFRTEGKAYSFSGLLKLFQSLLQLLEIERQQWKKRKHIKFCHCFLSFSYKIQALKNCFLCNSKVLHELITLAVNKTWIQKYKGERKQDIFKENYPFVISAFKSNRSDNCWELVRRNKDSQSNMSFKRKKIYVGRKQASI